MQSPFLSDHLTVPDQGLLHKAVASFKGVFILVLKINVSLDT